jgi:acyl carrier protein
MTSEQISDKLREIFQVVLDLPPDMDLTQLRKLVEPQWDSLAQTTIIAAIEGEFGIELDSSDMERISSFEAAQLLVKEKISDSDRFI